MNRKTVATAMGAVAGILLVSSTHADSPTPQDHFVQPRLYTNSRYHYQLSYSATV